MNGIRSRQLLGSMAEVADFLASVDLDALPGLFSVTITESYKPYGRVIAKAQLGAHLLDEAGYIDELRTWAAAFDGSMYLDDESNPGTEHAHRRLSALIPLPDGGLFEVWMYLYDLRPAEDWTPSEQPVSV